MCEMGQYRGLDPSEVFSVAGAALLTCGDIAEWML